MNKIAEIKLSNGTVRLIENVEKIEFRDATIFTVKYKDEKGKNQTLFFNLPIDIQIGLIYATSVTVKFNENHHN